MQSYVSAFFSPCGCFDPGPCFIMSLSASTAETVSWAILSSGQVFTFGLYTLFREGYYLLMVGIWWWEFIFIQLIYLLKCVVFFYLSSRILCRWSPELLTKKIKQSNAIWWLNFERWLLLLTANIINNSRDLYNENVFK